jgi:hypothetical protein
MAILAILAAIVIVAINPAKQLADARNAQRLSDVYAILSSVHQYAVDNEGAYPPALTETLQEICRTDGQCTGMADVSVLTDAEKYMVSMPRDPLCGSTPSCGENGTGYTIGLSAHGRVTVSAPAAEGGEVITITR